jgi:hypothetical protein
MLPLKATPREAVELPKRNDKNRQIAGEAVESNSVSEQPLPGKAVTCILDSRVRNVAPDAHSNIHRALAILRADLKVVEEAIQALELIAPEDPAERSGQPMPKPVNAPRKPRNVVDIHTNRA